jgi:hypothetical protein
MSAIDLTNKRFGRLIAKRNVGKSKWGSLLWLCKCDCGKDHTVASGKLIQGKSRSCGCYANDLHVAQLIQHGITVGGKPRTFIIWNGIKSRCLNPKSIGYKSYGGRGITICDQWLSFEAFHNWAINNGYQDGLTIDRIDNNKGYSPDNCKWTTARDNKVRQRKSIMIEASGIENSLSGWSKELLLSRYLLTQYYRRNGKERTATAINEVLRSGDKSIIKFFLTE